MTARHLSWNAFFVTLFLTELYGGLVGCIVGGPFGFFFGFAIAAPAAFVAGLVAALAYWVLGRMLVGRQTSTPRARWWSMVLGGFMGPLLAGTALGLLFNALIGARYLQTLLLAAAVGSFGGCKIWDCAESHARLEPTLFEPR